MPFEPFSPSEEPLTFQSLSKLPPHDWTDGKIYIVIICSLFKHLIFSFLDSALINLAKERNMINQALWDTYQTSISINRIAASYPSITAKLITSIICAAVLIAWDVSNIAYVWAENNLHNYQKDNNLALKGLYNWNPKALDTINQNVNNQNVQMQENLSNLGKWTYASITDYSTCLTNHIIDGLNGSPVTSCEATPIPQDFFTNPPALPDTELVKWTNTSIYDRISSIEKQMKSSHDEIINNQENMEKQVKTIAASIGKKAKCSKKPDDEVFNRNLLDIDEVVVDDDDELDLEVVEVIKREVTVLKDEVVTMNEEVKMAMKEEVTALKDMISQLVEQNKATIEQNKELIEQNKELMAKVSASA